MHLGTVYLGPQSSMFAFIVVLVHRLQTCRSLRPGQSSTNCNDEYNTVGKTMVGFRSCGIHSCKYGKANMATPFFQHFFAIHSTTSSSKHYSLLLGVVLYNTLPNV
eukprot:PhF_6_TR25696/c1_g1_i1/m.36215